MNRHDQPHTNTPAQACSSTRSCAEPLHSSNKARRSGRHNQKEAHMGDGSGW